MKRGNLPFLVEKLDGVVGVAETEAPLHLHPELAWKSKEKAEPFCYWQNFFVSSLKRAYLNQGLVLPSCIKQK
jgi:hypothetical protein